MPPKLCINPKRQQLKAAVRKGEFWKPCPGTSKDYLCCGYRIVTPMTGCGMYCQYCVLQVYLDDECQTVFENFGDLENEIHDKMAEFQKTDNDFAKAAGGSRLPRCRVIRIGTGEFSDSLHQENKLGLSKKIAAIFDRYDNVLLEFKTKSANIFTLNQIKKPQKTVIGFSLNTEKAIGQFEKGTAPLIERFKAARRCEEMGFSVAFHFDPIIWCNNWEAEYRRTVSMIYDHIKDVRKIAWCSMGGFRCMPPLKNHLRQTWTHLLLFAGEMIIGADGKLRYPRTIRVDFYRAMADQFKKHHPDAPLYLCMESREVWEECGMYERIAGYGGDGNDKLIGFLDDRAETILSQSKI